MIFNAGDCISTTFSQTGTHLRLTYTVSVGLIVRLFSIFSIHLVAFIFVRQLPMLGLYGIAIGAKVVFVTVLCYNLKTVKMMYFSCNVEVEIFRESHSCFSVSLLLLPFSNFLYAMLGVFSNCRFQRIVAS